MTRSPPTHLMKRGDTHILVRPGAEKNDGVTELCWITDTGSIIWPEHDENIHWVLSLFDIEEECL